MIEGYAIAKYRQLERWMSYDLFMAWYGVADWCTYTLLKKGEERVVLQPLGYYSRAATIIACGAAESENYMHRKIAAELAGRINQPPDTLLLELLNSESERDRQLHETDNERLNMQSVVEDIVFAAARWIRVRSLQSAGLSVLEQIVLRTIDGQYWNTSRNAMAVLCNFSHRKYRNLADRYLEFAEGEPPIHPTTTSLENDRDIAKAILAKNKDALRAVDRLIDQQDTAPLSQLSEEENAALDWLLKVAAYFEESA